MGMKRGRLSNEEARYITENANSISVEDIAENLDRNPSMIENFLKKNLKMGLSEFEQAAYELEDRPYWIELEQQFTEDELELFKYHWSRIINQFKDDVFPTEELQVVDVIKLEMLMNRCLKQNKENIDQINAFEGLLQVERQAEPEHQDKEVIFNLDRQIASLRAAQESMNEDSKQTFTGWVAHLMQNPAVTQQYGMEMEKMRLAMEQEKERLSVFHKYEDGQVDQPFLTPDTVKD